MLAEIERPHAKLALAEGDPRPLTPRGSNDAADDPTVGIKVHLPRTKGWHSWTDEEVAHIAPIGAGAATNGWCLSSRSRRPRGAVKSSGWARST